MIELFIITRNGYDIVKWQKRHASNRVEVNEYMNDIQEDMHCDIEVYSFKKAYVGCDLQSDMEESLFLRWNIFTRLSVVLRLFNLKAKGGWMNTSLTELLELLKEIYQEGNTLSDLSYEAKNILCYMGLNYIRIQECCNDYILYKKGFENLKECPRCGESCYKLKDNGVKDDDGLTRKDVPTKVMWYL